MIVLKIYEKLKNKKSSKNDGIGMINTNTINIIKIPKNASFIFIKNSP